MRWPAFPRIACAFTSAGEITRVRIRVIFHSRRCSPCCLSPSRWRCSSRAQIRKLPADKVLVPGVLDTSCNFVEHPELVAQRIVRYAELVGRDRVIAGTDCGFGTFAGFAVHPAICWEK